MLTMCRSLVTCGIYYYVWVFLLPKWKGYQLRQEVVGLDDGAQTHRITKVPNDQVDEWDAAHDATGRLHVGTGSESEVREKSLQEA